MFCGHGKFAKDIRPHRNRLGLRQDIFGCRLLNRLENIVALRHPPTTTIPYLFIFGLDSAWSGTGLGGATGSVEDARDEDIGDGGVGERMALTSSNERWQAAARSLSDLKGHS